MKATIFSGILYALGSAELYGKKLSYEPEPLRQYPKANLYSLYRSTGNFRDAKSAEFGAIQGAQESITTPTRSIDSLFLRLPSSAELDELILSADSVAILKTIQVVATDDSLPCDQKISYLLELLGRMRCAIEKKQFSAEQLETIIEGALEEIKRLEKQIGRLEDDKKALWLDELRDKLAKLVKDLQDVYHHFNQVEAQIPPEEAKVTGYEKEIQILTKRSDAERNRIAQDKLKLIEVEAIIRDLENQLRAAKDRKAALEDSLKRSEGVIADNDKKIAKAREEIQRLEEEISKLRGEADKLRGKFTDLEIKVERLRTEISVAEAKEDKINEEIDRNIDKINFEKKKIAQDELDDLNDMIGRLKELVPTTEKEIDRHYYYCYGDGSIQVEKTGEVIVFIVKGERFGDYLHSAYGQSVKIPAVSGDVHFSKVDIFGAPWTSKLGYPFVEHSFGDDFSCLNPSAAYKSSGKIESVDSSSIHVTSEEGKHLKLRVGSCSRIESTSELPKVGQSIFFSAVHSSADDYNLYSASCF